MIEILKSQTMNGTGAFSIFQAGPYTYIVPSWTKVPAKTKKEDVRVIDDGPVEPKKVVEGLVTKHTVQGSKGNMYEVIIDTKFGNSCSCPGFGFRRECKHIKEILNKK